jgi:hypothetical protein
VERRPRHCFHHILAPAQKATVNENKSALDEQWWGITRREERCGSLFAWAEPPALPIGHLWPASSQRIAMDLRRSSRVSLVQPLKNYRDLPPAHLMQFTRQPNETWARCHWLPMNIEPCHCPSHPPSLLLSLLACILSRLCSRCDWSHPGPRADLVCPMVLGRAQGCLCSWPSATSDWGQQPQLRGVPCG